MATLCPRHPGVPSTDLCVGCGEFVCGQCACVASDRRVFCPGCRERLSAEELAGLTAAAPGAARSGPPPARPGASRSPPATLQPLELLPPAEIPSPLWLAVKTSPVAMLVLLMGLVGFGCTPVAVGGAALGLNELRRNFTGTSHASTRLVIAAFATSVVVIMVRMALWKGR